MATTADAATKSLKSKQLKTFNLLKKPANGGIPAIENNKQLKVNPMHMFCAAKKLQFIKNLGKPFERSTKKITLNSAVVITKYTTM